MKILILGASGMVGSAMFRVLAGRDDWEVTGSVRTPPSRPNPRGRLLSGVDLANPDHLVQMFRKVGPDLVVNCVGLTKHLPGGNEPIPALTINALLPHRLAELCSATQARLVHVSTDCVFSGRKGNYVEDDFTDAEDVYGRTKLLGEVAGPNLLTLRTSFIGHEQGTRHGLLEWFLAQRECKGFRHAIFSGLPSVEFANLVRDVVIPAPSLSGVYHVAAAPIDKLSLLQLIATVYQRDTMIGVDEDFRIDRSLDPGKFAVATGYRAPSWPELVQAMYRDHLSGD